MAIPLMNKVDQARTVERADKIRLLIRGERWTFEETLRAFAAVVFWSGGAKRKKAIAWLEELLTDLSATPNTDAVDVWSK